MSDEQKPGFADDLRAEDMQRLGEELLMAEKPELSDNAKGCLLIVGIIAALLALPWVFELISWYFDWVNLTFHEWSWTARG